MTPATNDFYKAKIRFEAASNLDSSRPNLFWTANNFQRKQIIKHNIQIEPLWRFCGLYIQITPETASIKDRPIHARNQFTLSAWLKIFTVPALFTDTNIRQRIREIFVKLIAMRTDYCLPTFRTFSVCLFSESLQWQCQWQCSDE